MPSNRVTAIKRLKKELDDIKKNPLIEVMVGPSDDSNFFHWEGFLNGPDNSPYAGGVFKFEMDFSEEYPMRPPKVKFITKVYHPNINSEDGQICVDILQDQWSSAFTVSRIMISISSLLTDPNPDSPLNRESAQLYINNRAEYNKLVKQWVRKYARPEALE